MTMVAPETMIQECLNKSYKELLVVRDKYFREIKYFEKNEEELMKEDIISPSPDVHYQWNLDFLGKLFPLIEEKFKEKIGN
jgi:hypothetical protein